MELMESWKLGVRPEAFPVQATGATYAVLLMMAGDGDLARALQPDIDEMARVAGSEIAVLALVDTPGDDGVRVIEIRSGGAYTLEKWPEISTGDPRPLSDFLARGLLSFSEKTRFAIGFWGHGTGIFHDYDAQELVIERAFRFGPLGAPISEEGATEAVVDRRRGKSVLSRSMMPDMTSENALTNREASSALAVAFSRVGRTEKVDMVFFDACLCGSVEVFTEVRPFAETVVASALLVPGGGWQYAYWLKATEREQPKDAATWAYLAVGTFGSAYDQRTYPQAAQLGAFFSDGVFVEAFAELVEALKRRGGAGVRLVSAAARGSDSVQYGENIDLKQLVDGIYELTDDEELKTLAFEFSERYVKGVVALSIPPKRGERLSGMTVWCPIKGDREGVTHYYRGLEFDRLTGWLDFLQTGAERSEEQPRVMTFGMFGFWGLELKEAKSVEFFSMNMEADERSFALAIPEDCAVWAGDLVEGVYGFHGGAGSIQFPNYVVIRELYRHLVELRENDEEFAALAGACERGWVIGAEACAALVEDFKKYESRYDPGDPQDKELYIQMRMALEKVSKDGVVVFA